MKSSTWICNNISTATKYMVAILRCSLWIYIFSLVLGSLDIVSVFWLSKIHMKSNKTYNLDYSRNTQEIWTQVLQLKAIKFLKIIHTKTNSNKRSSPLQGQLALALQLKTKHTHVLQSCFQHTHTYNTWGALEHEGKRGWVREEWGII